MRRRALLLVFLCLGVLVWQPAEAISLGSIRNSLVQWVLDMVSVEGVFEISVEQVVDAETEGTTLKGVQIADADGVWFTARELTFDFDRSRLLLGQLFIDNLELIGAEIFRKPVVPAGEEVTVNLEGAEPPPEPDTPFYWPRSPVTAAIRHLALTDITVHEEVLGQAISFDATGSFRDQGEIQAAQLSLKRTDAIEGVIEFSYSRDFDANTLAVDLDAHEAAGGLVAALAGLPADVPATIVLKAEGTPDAFKTDFDMKLTGFVQAEGKATIDYAGPISIDGVFAVMPGPQMPANVAQVMGERAELVVKAGEGPDQTVKIETARIDSPYLNAAMTGTWARATGAIEAKVDLTAAPELVTTLTGVDFKGLSFRGDISGKPGTLAAAGQLVLNGLAMPQLAVEKATLDITLRQSEDAGITVNAVTANGLVAGLRLDRIQPDVIGDARLDLAVTVKGNKVELETAAIESRVLTLGAAGTADTTSGDFAIDYRLTAPDLGPVLGAYGVIGGAGQIEATGRAIGAEGVVTATTTARLSGFESGVAGAESLTLEGRVVQAEGETRFELTGDGKEVSLGKIGPDVLGSADLEVAGALENGLLTLSTARLDTPILDMSAGGKLDTRAGSGQIDFQVSAPELSPVAAAYGHDLAGALAVTGAFELKPDGSVVTAKAALTELAGEVTSQEIVLDAKVASQGPRTDFNITANGRKVSLDLAGEGLSGPLDMELRGALDGDALTLEVARIASPVLDANVAGELDLGQFGGSVDFDIENTRLAAFAPLLGVEASGVLAAEGRATMTADGAASVEGTARLVDLVYSGSPVGDVAATFDLSMAGAPGGMLRLELTDSAYAPDGPGLFTLAMSGTPEIWLASFELAAPNYLTVRGGVDAAWAGSLAIDANVTAEAGEKLPSEYARLLGDGAELVVGAAEDAEGVIRISRARLSSPALEAQISGHYAPESGVADLDLHLAARPALAAPFEGTEFAGLTLDGKLTGAPGSLTGSGALDLKGIGLGQVVIGPSALRLRIDQTGSAGAPITNIALGGHVDRLQAAGIDPDAIGQLQIGLDAVLAGDKLTISRADIDSKLASLQADGTANIATMAFDLAYDLAAPALAPLAEAFGVDAGGSLAVSGRVARSDGALHLETSAALANLQSPFANARRVTVQGSVAQKGDRTVFDLTGASAGLRLGGQGGEVVGDADLRARGTLDGDRLALDIFRLNAPFVQAEAGGEVNLRTGGGRLEYGLSDLALGVIGPAFDLAMAGTASAEGTFGLADERDIDGPALTGAVKIADLAFGGSAIGDLVLTHDVVLSAAPHGRLELALTGGPNAPAKVATNFRLEGQRLTIDGLDARAFGATGSGDLAVDLAKMAADGALHVSAAIGPAGSAEIDTKLRLRDDRLTLGGLSVQAAGLAARGEIAVNLKTMLAEGGLSIARAELAPLGDLIGAPVAGTAEGRLRLSAEGGQQQAMLDLDMLGVRVNDLAIGKASLEGRIADLLGTPRLDLTAKAEEVVKGEVELATATLTARGPLSGVAVTLRGEGHMREAPLSISADASADLAGTAMQATLSDLELALGDDRIALTNPLHVTSRGGTLQVSDIAVSLPDEGRLTGDFTWYGGPMAGSILLDAPDLSFLDRAFGVPVKAGALRAEAVFDTRRGHAGARITVAGKEIVTADLIGAGPVSVDGSLDWDGRILTLDLRADGDFEKPLVIMASLPVRATGGLPTLAGSGPASAKIDWKGEIGDIWALIPLPGHVMTGRMAVDIRMSGDIASPTISGGFQLDDGVYQNLDSGVIVNGLSLATSVGSTGISAVQLQTIEGSDPSLRLEGQVGLVGEKTDLSIKTTRPLVLRRDDAIVKTKVDMQISAAPEAPMEIGGKVRILAAEIRLVNANPPGIVTLGDVRIKGQPLVFNEGGGGLPVRLKIDIDSTDKVFVRGRGLNSQWEVHLQIRGSISAPRIIGKIEAERGSLDLVGREFDLETGLVQFGGGATINPRLDVVLVREAEGITGRMIVSGSALDPRLSFSSTPSLPEDEVLPRLLFGASSQALTPAQGLQLAMGLATLMNGGGGTLDQVRATLGLDALSIEQGDEGAVLEVGKQVGERVWVGTRQSLEGAGTTVAVEVEIFDDVEAYGEVDTEGESTVGVRWRTDF